MNARRIAWSIVGVLSVSVEARAGPVVYTDLAAFQAAAGDVREIDFETLPDGSPSYFGALITPEFNYTDEGVEFFSHEPLLRITGNATAGFNLRAGPTESEGPRNWMIAELVAPAYAVGINYLGTSYLALYSPNGSFLNEWVFGGSGTLFLGVVSDVPIGTAVIDRRGNSATIESFFYTPVPEPATLMYLTVGVFALLRTMRSRRLELRGSPKGGRRPRVLSRPKGVLFVVAIVIVALLNRASRAIAQPGRKRGHSIFWGWERGMGKGHILLFDSRNSPSIVPHDDTLEQP